MSKRVDTVALTGVAARLVEVEVDMSRGLPTFNVVGLPEATVREAKERVRSALQNSGYALPSRRITINLAPADLPKDGGGYDLPMALGVLAAMGQIPPHHLENRLFMGELALDGRIKPVPGCLPAALFARERGIETLVVPYANGSEAALVPDINIAAATTLSELVNAINGSSVWPLVDKVDWHGWLTEQQVASRDLVDVRGQEYAKRALEVVAAGGHNMIMSGPPGSGKTLLARCLPDLLPPMTLSEALEVTAIYSVVGKLTGERPVVCQRPFRTPHHTASQVSLIGGGSTPRPGEVSMAHRGVLFLDEIPEFGRPVLEVLREPLEAGVVTVARAAGSVTFPARFQLVAACNPCPCGHFGDSMHMCRCSGYQIERYRARLSGPLLDRIDLHVEVPPVPFEKLGELPSGESSAQVRKRVVAAREIQLRRNGNGRLNADMEGNDLNRVTVLDGMSQDMLLQASRRMGFSARTYHRILRVARTIADLSGSEAIQLEHLAEAIHYRVGGRFLEEQEVR
ncbi:MAG: YifB family Mg chelatase-like AAA ATPase [Magnetococcales bacterium]|nr:YifB family Mg chelatase-like AAA ATPase [Magnetococcales bacterium]NGZ27098.1 YifB family Mg chelatase-like AAA ATPase [Magnetococcales bacterium]